MFYRNGMVSLIALAWAGTAFAQAAGPTPNSSSAAPVAGAEPSAEAAVAQSPVAQIPAGVADAQPGEIIVTARRRAESLSTIPVAVSVYNQAALVARGAVDIRTFANATPSTLVTTSPSSRNAALLSIRGQYQSDSLITLDPSVGVYVDDVYIARAYGVLTELLDIESAEVLKGPQGTLFGRNTNGGAIRLTTVKPDLEKFGGYARVGYGNYDTVTAVGALNVPVVSDVLALRYAVAYGKHDGYTKAFIVPRPTAGGTSTTPVRQVDTDDRNSFSQRLSLAFVPTDRLRIDLSGEMVRSHDNNQLFVNQAGDIVTNAVGTPTFAVSPQRQNDFYSVLTDATPYSKLRTYGARAAAAYDITDGITFKAIYGYRRATSRASSNTDGSVISPAASAALPAAARFPGALSQNATTLFQQAYQHSVEGQLLGNAFDDRLDWILGGFWFREKGIDYQNTRTQQDATVRQSSERGASPFFRQGLATNTSKSVFAHVGYKLTDQLSISGGIRYTKDNKDLALTAIFPTGNPASPSLCLYPNNPPQSVNAGGVCRLLSPSGSDFLSLAGDIGYKANDDVYIYAKGANGYRSGGGQARAIDLFSATQFRPEKVLEFEVGVKTHLFQRRATLNLAAFHSHRKNIQAQDTLQVSLPGIGLRPTTFNFNSGTGDITGVEAEGTARLGAGFSVEAGAAYLSEVRTDAGLPSRDPTLSLLFPVVGNKQFNGNASLVYDRELDFGTLNARIDYVRVAPYVQNQYLIVRQSPFSKIPGYNLLNARTTLTLSNNISVSGYVKNLTATKYYRGLFNSGAFFPATIGDPRTYGVEVGFKF